ncbi:putative calcium-transporting ATPase 13, plasma membrane-type [Salvia miltiorrhiza]|uniref:putative calcium-transporting ATPase 13, plasma membrane-type n=1 Tax=Salvia miltiorrhiza TaxID=226208 RepID=UPI0025AD29F5|nr:putative calcium-transporting ATPase 13, plasma membrane-type [Salvia miltiorrhiza]
MSAIIHTTPPCMELLLLSDHLHASVNLNRKRWRKAFAAVYCSRAFLKHFPLSTIAIDVVDHAHNHDHHFPGLNRSALNHLVKNKNRRHLSELGGSRGVAASLETDPHLGITGDQRDLAARHEAFGKNTYPSPPAKTLLHFTLEALKDPTILILLACAALSLGFGIKENGPKEGWYDGGSIFVAVFLVVAVSAASNFKQSRQFDKLSEVSSNILVQVVRNGRRQEVSIHDVVVGDVVVLNIGDQVPADGLFLEGHSLQVDESQMTGESDGVEVDSEVNPFIFSGTKVADGYGKMVVTAVGMDTLWGEMMSTISRDADEQTPLQSRLNGLTSSIGKLGLAVAFLVLSVLLIRYFTGNTEDENGEREFRKGETKADDVINSVLGIIAAAVTIVVVAIPEGLPLAVTLTLAFSMKRMMADQAMVRKLSACETMGSATTICTDKTGTLTLNKMKVTKFWLGKELFEGGGLMGRYVVELLHHGVGLNTTGGVYGAGEGLEFSGSPTEKAILSWAVVELSMDMEEVRRGCEVLHVEAFNSEKKRSGVLLKKFGDGEIEIHVHWKGAAEMILAMCSHYYDFEGNIKDLNDEERNELNHIIQGMAASSLRCIAFAHKQISECDQANLEKKKIQENGLILLGLVGLKDPCRPGVRKAVQDCRGAGVAVKMITGDNVFTATAIATECGILEADQENINECVVDGAEFRGYTDEERMERVEAIRVMARASPFDKLLVVQCLRRKGHVVAVTGDGTNDAPALKEADIGLSMGIQGTEVAKQSSDIVIMDDNFASVVTVLRWGRCVYNNIQKFIQFQLTVNVAALTINFVAAVSAGEVPLTAVQLLWVNLIMDTLGALALATEKPTRELMERRPVGRSEALITNVMWRNLTAQAAYQIAVLLVLQFRGVALLRVSRGANETMIFNAFVLCQVFNEFNARKMERRNVFEGLHRNKVFVGIVGVTLVLQVVMVEFLNKFADTERLDLGQWGICVGIAAAAWPIAWVVKLVPVPERPFFNYFGFKKWTKRAF